LDEIKIREELERISIESAVDYDLNVHINKFSLDAQEDMNTKSHVNSNMTGGARKNPIDFSKIKCENGKCGARSTKQVPFTLVQMQAIYDTFKNTQKTYPKKKAKWLKETKSREKRQFFCNILNENKEFKYEIPEGHNSFIYLLKGELKIGEKDHDETNNSNLILLKRGKKLKVKANKKTEFLFISGKPIGEPIARGGPFVMNTKAEILEAIQDYNNGTFAKY